MGRDEHVGKGPELAVLGQWLDSEDIKDSTTKLTALQCSNEFWLASRRSTADVHEYAALLHLAETVSLVEETDSVCRLREDPNNKISLGIHTVELVKADDLVTVGAVLVTGLVRASLHADDLGPKGSADARAGSTDITETNDCHGLLRAEINGAFLPPALLLLLIKKLDTLCVIQHAKGDVLA